MKNALHRVILTVVPRLRFLVIVVFAAACNRTPSPPQGPGGDTGQTITGREHVGWDQPAADAVELGTLHYVIYVDNARVELAASCDTSSTSGRFACSAPLPPMPAGPHTLQLATFAINNGQIVESARSASLQVTVSSGAAPPQSEIPGAALRPGVSSIDGRSTVSLVTIAAGDQPVSDLAVAPDGRVFAADAGGRVRVIQSDAADEPPVVALQLEGPAISLALDPQFTDTHAVFVLSAGRASTGSMTFAVARFREVSGTLGDRVPLLDDVKAAALPRGVLRFGPDGALYAAFDDSGDATKQGDLASPNGKILRLNRDGSTPRDQPAGSPVYAFPFVAPSALAWDLSGGVLWALDSGTSPPTLSALIERNPAVRRPDAVLALGLPQTSNSGTAVFYSRDELPSLTGTLLVAAGTQGLLRVRAKQNPTTPEAIDRILAERVPAAGAVAAAPDGSLYVAAGGTVARIAAATPSRR